MVANRYLSVVVFFGKDDLQFVSFKVADSDYGVSVGDVVGIYKGLATIPTPDMPPYMEGEICLNDRRVPVLSLRRFSGLSDLQMVSANRWIVVVEHASGPVGISVDSVTEVMKLKADALDSLTIPENIPAQSYIAAVAHAGNIDLMLPDFSRLFHDAITENI